MSRMLRGRLKTDFFNFFDRFSNHNNAYHHTYLEPRVKRAFPKTLPASPVFTGTSSLPPR